MKKLLFTLLFSSIMIATNAQTFIAVPSYSSVTNTFASSTGNIKFYFGSTSQTLTVGRGANGVCFFGNNMFVAMDDGGASKGILWYANVSFATGTFASDSPVVLTNGQGTFSVAADASGNIYSANSDGTVTKFIRGTTAPFYSSSNVTTAIFWNTPSSFASTGGVMIDDATSTIWAVSYANNQAAVCKLSAFGTASSLKKINTNGSYIQKPEGIIKDNLGNIWIGNNNNNYVLRINIAAVNTIISELNAANYTTKTLTEGTNINDFAVSAAGHQLGGIVYDNLYSSKLYINDQLNAGNTFIYSFTPTNATPTFTATTMSQIYPGAGQCAIVPCALLPVPIANAVSINAGQTANLVASNCATGTTYQWKDGTTIVGTSAATYTTPVLNTSKTYTVACVNSASCIGTATNVNVTVTASCTPPAVPTLAASPTGVLIGTSSTLTATGCNTPNTLIWSNGLGTGTTKNVTPNATTTYTASCSNGTCSSANGSVTVTLLSTFPNPALVGYLHNWDDAGNGLPYMQLDAVPAAYNVINYSFGVAQSGTTDNIQLTLVANVDANAATRTQTFIQKMNTVQNQGRKVLLSLGGAVNSGGVINVGTTVKRDNFITSVTNLLKIYPFDGLDIDIEGGSGSTSTLIFNQAGMTVQVPNSPTINNLIYALKQIMLNYRSIRGKKMLLTFAPERHMITGGLSSYAYANIESSASYLPMIEALKDSLDLVHTQLYGYGSDNGRDASGNRGSEYCVGTEGNALAVTEDLLLGYTLENGQGTFSGLPANKIALGLAAPCVGASAGFLTIAKIQSVVNYFRGTGSQPPASTPTNCSWMTSGQAAYAKLSSGNVNFRGLMTWSINYDVNVACSNNSFANNYLSLYSAFTTSANAKNILTFSIPSQVGSSVINSTTNTITVTMPAGTNLASLVPTFTLSPNCTAAKLSGTAQNFSGSFQYTINHSDYSSKTWTVIVSLASSCTPPANPSSASANPAAIPSGQTSNLSASGCALGNTYQWNNGLIISTNASFTTPALSMPTTYTVYCVNGSCLSAGISVTVNICTTPANPTSASASPSSINAGQTSTLTASGCNVGQTYIWYDGLSPVGFNATFTTPALSSPKTYTVHCVSNTCKSLGVSVSVAINGACPPTISITSAAYPSYTSNQVVQAGQYITTSSPPNIVVNSTNSNKLIYQAGNSVTLSPGFSVQNGAVFSAKILGCASASPPYNYQKISYQYGTDPNSIPLIVDVYQPSVATAASRKPLIIFTHGTGGSESNPHGTGDHDLAKFLAQNDGFVAAYFNFFGSDNTRLQTDATHLPANYNAVINYLKTNAATYGINVNAIILHGVSGSAAAASSVALNRGDIFGCITEAGGRNVGLESYEPATITNTVSMAGVQSQSDGGFGEYRYNAADVRSGAAHNYSAYTENTALAVVASPGQQGYCSAYNDCSLNEGLSYYTTKYGAAKITQYPLIVAGQSHGADATTQVAWDNFMKTKPKIMLNNKGITW